MDGSLVNVRQGGQSEESEEDESRARESIEGDENSENERNTDSDDGDNNSVTEEESESCISNKIKCGIYKLCIAEKKGKKLTSTVWTLFRFVQNHKNIIISNKIACSQCLKVYKHTRRSGYKHLELHIKGCVKKENAVVSDIEKYALKNTFKKHLTRFVCEDLHPIQSIKGGGLKNLANHCIELGSLYGNKLKFEDLCCHPTTLSRHIVSEADEERYELKLLMHRIQSNGIAMSADMWKEYYTSKDYIGINLHFIHNSKMEERTLCIKEFEFDKKDHGNIETEINDQLALFELCRFNIKFVTDRGGNMVAAFDDDERVDCAAHMINSIVDYMIKKCTNQRLAKNLKSCHELVTYFKRSSLQSKLPKTIKQESETRWNGLLIMIDSIHFAWDAIIKTLEVQKRCDLIDAIDKDVLNELIEFLKPFQEASLQFQFNTKPTLHLVALHRDKLLQHLNSKGGSSILKSLKSLGKEYIHSKWILKPYHKIALFLHPRMRKLSRFQKEERHQIITHVKEAFKYIKTTTAEDVEPTQNEEQQCSPAKKNKKSILDEFIDGEVDDILHEDEIDKYIHHEFKINDDEMNESELDICKWWEKRKSSFPTLYKMFLRVMCIPAASSTIESKFSASGQLISCKQTRYNPETVDNILFLNNRYKKDDYQE